MSRENYSTYYNIQIKKAPEGANSINGAAIGTISEPPEIFNIMENQESQILLRRISELLAA